MNKYPERSYNDITEIAQDADLDLTLRDNSIQIYDHTIHQLNIKASNKDDYHNIAMSIVNKTINQYINTPRLE